MKHALNSNSPYVSFSSGGQDSPRTPHGFLLPELQTNQKENTAKIFMDQWDQLIILHYIKHYIIGNTTTIGELLESLMPNKIITGVLEKLIRFCCICVVDMTFQAASAVFCSLRLHLHISKYIWKCIFFSTLWPLSTLRQLFEDTNLAGGIGGGAREAEPFQTP